MYVPKIYQCDDFDYAKKLLSKHSFAQLTGVVNGRPWGVHLPLIIEGNQSWHLTGHVSKANAIHQNFNTEQEVLASFMHDHAYISSSWYQKPNVPTWNYEAVHVYGKCVKQTQEELLSSLNTLIDIYEKRSQHPISMSMLTPSNLREARGIFGFKLIPTEIQIASKCSQNRDDQDFKNIVTKLENRSYEHERNMANIMKSQRPQLF